MKTILVALDFDDHETTLIDMAAKFAKPFEAKVWLVHIAEPDPDFVGYEVGPEYIMEARNSRLDRENEILQEYSDNLRKKGIDSDCLLIEGATIQAVLNKAENLKADLIITGHEKHNFLYSQLFGSVAKGVINKSKIPVLVVPTS